MCLLNFHFTQVFNISNAIIRKSGAMYRFFSFKIEAINEQYYVVGYVSYECATVFGKHFGVCEPDEEFPLGWFGIYEKPIHDNDIGQKREYSVSDWRTNTTGRLCMELEEESFGIHGMMNWETNAE